MDAIELIGLLERGEDSNNQFKLSQDVTNAKSLAGEMVAFSNSSGGRIFIGVTDLGEPIGISAADVRRINQLLSNTATNNVRPPINPETENVLVGGHLVMVVNIRAGISKPYSDTDGVIWVKSGSDKRRVTSREEIQRISQSVHLVHADEVPVEGTSTADIDMTHFETFFERQYEEPLHALLSREKLSLDQLLSNLGLAKEASLNLAGLMLFGHHPQRRCPALIVKCVSFVGNELYSEQYRDSQDIEGCLRDLHRQTMSFLTRNLRRTQGTKGVNTQGELEVSASALEELVVNMLLHRDYFISAPWRVMIFDNRIEIISPGALPNNLTVENVRNGVSVIRNPLITSYATKGNELPYRGIGTGIRRALESIPALELESDRERNLFIARIPRQADI